MKLELVFIPSPGDGHLRPLVELAKLLVDRDDRLSITFIIIPSMKGYGTESTSSYITSLSTASKDRLRYNVLSLADESKIDESDFISYVESCKPVVKATVAKLTDPARPNSRRLIGFVVDMMCTAMFDVADELDVPNYLFFASNASFLGFQLHFQHLYDVDKFDVSELKDSKITELKVPSLSRPIPVKCFPSMMLSKEWFRILPAIQSFRKSKGILVNSFAELEPQPMKFFSGGDNSLPTVYTVGPILNLKTNGLDLSEDEQPEILRWLDEQPPKSVVFLCFGSMGGFREDQVKEIAIALDRSGHRFVWCLRRASSIGTLGGVLGTPGEFTNLEEILPEGFLERTAEIGKIISWAPQNAILANPAIGGFVSHCGWNSILESLWFGVPIATWPLYAEQQVNAFVMVEELGLAVEIRNSFRTDFTESELMTAEEIERGIRCLMEKDSDVRKRVKEMSEKSHVALMDGGSSHVDLLKFIHDVTNNIP